MLASTFNFQAPREASNKHSHGRTDSILLYYSLYFKYLYNINNLCIIAGQYPGRAAVHHTGGGGAPRGSQGPRPYPGHGFHRFENTLLSAEVS
jgi:hypothetical protein